MNLDDLARACARELQAGQSPAPAELGLEIGDHGEPDVTLFTLWDPEPAREFRRLPESRLVHRPGRFFGRDGSWAVAVPADPALALDLAGFVAERPDVRVDERVVELLDELVTEHERASRTVALSYAEDAELDGLELGGVLHPFQRAGVRYALERRRTFIADEQGLGKTVQALAALEVDGAFPAVVVCPASMKLMWEREASLWLPEAKGGGARRTHRRHLDRGGHRRRDRRPQLRHPGSAPGTAGRARSARAGAGRVPLRQEPGGAPDQGGDPARGAAT